MRKRITYFLLTPAILYVQIICRLFGVSSIVGWGLPKHELDELQDKFDNGEFK